MTSRHDIAKVLEQAKAAVARLERTMLLTRVLRGESDEMLPIEALIEIHNGGPMSPQETLHLATSCGNAVLMRKALATGVDVDGQGVIPEPPLVEASRKGNVEAVQILIEAGASVDKQGRALVRDGTIAPLHVAASHGNTEVVRLLLAAGATVDLGTEDRQQTPLMCASWQGQTECARLLLAAGAVVDQQTSDGFTSLEFACKGGHVECAQLLLDAGAPTAEAGGALALASSVLDNDGVLEVARLLLRAGVPVDVHEGAHGLTPLLVACDSGNAEMARLLLECGAAPDKRGARGVGLRATPMRCACLKKRVDLVQLLLSYGASREHVSGEGTPSAEEEFSAREGYEAVVEALRASRDWCTPLHHVEALTPARARALLREGANLHARARPDAESPLERARRIGPGQPGRDAAEVVLQAAAAWGPDTHELWSHDARARAVELLQLGWRLSRSASPPGPFDGAEQALMDLWREKVVPHALDREFRGA